MRSRESALSVFAVLCLSFLLFSLAGTTPTVSVAYADNSGGGNLPVDTCADSSCTSIGDSNSDTTPIIETLIDIINAVL